MSQTRQMGKVAEGLCEINWENYLKSYYEKPQSVRTWSGYEVKETYTPKDRSNEDYKGDIGDPGVFPFARGIHRILF